MSSLTAYKVEKVLQTLDLNIPKQLHHQPILANIIKQYDLLVTFTAAVLDRKATDGGWFTLNLEGHPQEVAKAMQDLENSGVKIFPHPQQAIEIDYQASASVLP